MRANGIVPMCCGEKEREKNKVLIISKKNKLTKKLFAQNFKSLNSKCENAGMAFILQIYITLTDHYYNNFIDACSPKKIRTIFFSFEKSKAIINWKK